MFKKFTKILSDDNRIYDKDKLSGFEGNQEVTAVPEVISPINCTVDKLSKEIITRYLIENIRDSLDLDQVLQTTVKEIGKLFKADRCILALYNNDELKFEIKIEYKSSKDTSSVLHHYNIENISQRWLTDLVFNKIPIIINDIHSVPLDTKYLEYFEQNNIKSLLAVPLVYKTKLKGLIALHYSTSEHKLQFDQIDFLKDISNQIVIAINQAELCESANNEIQKEELIREVLEAAKGNLDIPEIQNKLVTIVGKTFKADKCFIKDFNNELDRFLPVKEYAEYFSSPDLKRLYCLPDEAESFIKNEYKKGNCFIIPDFEEFLDKQNPLYPVAKKHIEHYGIFSNYCFPIIIQEKLKAAFVIQFKKKTYFNPEEIDLLKIIVSHVNVSLRQAELYSITKRMAEREIILREIIDEMRSSFDIKKVKKAFVTKVGKLFGAERCFIYEFGPESTESRVDEYSEYLSRPDLKSIVNEPIRLIAPEWSHLNVIEKREFYIPDTQKYLIEKNMFGTGAEKHIIDYDIKSVVGMPIFYANEIQGTLAIHFSKKNAISEEDINFIRTITDQAGIALHQAKLFEEEKKRAERESLLRKVTETIRNTLDINEIKSSLVNEIGRKFNADKCFFWEYDNNNKEFIDKIKFEYLTSPELGKPYTYGKEVNNFVLESYKKTGCFLIPDFIKYIDEVGYMGEIARHQMKNHCIRSNYCFGLLGEDEFLGAFAIQYKKPTYLSDEDIGLLKTVVNQATTALKQANLYSTTKKQAENLNRLAKREALISGITRNLLSSLDPDEIERKLINEVGATFNADKCFIRPIDHKKMTFLPVAVEYRSSPDIKSIASYGNEDDEYLIREYEKGNGFEIPDIGNRQDDSIPKSLVGQLLNNRINANYSYPMFYKGDFIGFFVIQYTKATYLSEGNIQLLKTIVNQASIALGQAILYKKTQNLAEREALLRKIAQTMIISTDYNGIKVNMVKEVGKAFKADRCFIRLFKNNNEFDPIDIEYLACDDIKPTKGYKPSDDFDLFVESFLSQEPMIFPDISSAITDFKLGDSYKEFVELFNVKSNYAIPIFNDNDLMGVFVLHYVKEKRYLYDSEIELLQTIATSTGMVLKQAELYAKAQQATKAKSEFLANMSHEFRTPLNAIIGFTDMIMNGNYGKLSDKGYKYLQNISSSGKHLLSLVNDLLDISKIEAGKTELNYQNLESRDIIQETVLCLESLVKDKNITVNLDLQDINVEADPVRFRQIVYNLLNNAIKFTPNGGKVKIATNLDGSNLVTSVEDNGIGIARKDHKKIFEQFRQIDSSYSRAQEGTGLGLSLTKKLVELHGGSIYFESKKGKGTKFWFTLPKAEIQNLVES